MKIPSRRYFGGQGDGEVGLADYYFEVEGRDVIRQVTVESGKWECSVIEIPGGPLTLTDQDFDESEAEGMARIAKKRFEQVWKEAVQRSLEGVPVRFAKGDLFCDDRLDALAHGCNCAGAMGRGIAVEFKRRWPMMYQEYRKRCVDGRFGLGEIFVWQDEGMTIFNLGTQPHWREPARIDAIRSAMAKTVELGNSLGIKKLGLPRIGAGLGGIPWQYVRPILAGAATKAKFEMLIAERHLAGKPMKQILPA